MSVDTIAIVGTGVAGATAALTLRDAGFDGRVLLIGEEPHAPYRRPPLSKDVLRGSMPDERTRLRPAEHWATKGVELRTGARVTGIAADAHEIVLLCGETLGYDRLLLATGGRPRTLPVTDGVPGVFTLRTLGDVPALRDALTAGTRVLVVGAGLVGAEVAASARAMDCAVTVLEVERTPLARVLPPVIGVRYAGLHRAAGVDLRTGTGLKSLAHNGSELVAIDTDGAESHADVVVVAVGMVPNTALAETAGIEIDRGPVGGITVDSQGATSAPDVYAAGDVANLPNRVLGGRQRVEHWMHAQDHGAATARAMLGQGTPFDVVPWCWSDQHGVTVHITGWPDAGDEVRLDGDLDGMNFAAEFRRDGKLVGAVGVNRAAQIRLLRKEIAARTSSEAIA
ncbi:NADPH-dependent 2,4-dienoyl-CoA reductase/sulfur reductase-like enzyme [Herbihabitans rhizosphaerae]|uniref:NADPH-dependent 2,4-dienoyl-CoA reductase/sulfur reductase-like enzyme n=1 Tax=Herbihabitans rhizosphaerae TaxID=1872711 RepID=A0A4Q7KLN2_9PSEU|nr:FAD-dependent oxidoreductase [Herbihabitans rhizosphaerae]RZS36461.1 NADPH-dependent 2,4-dienoyl-CoA reductase/sulfur reductase-like enzyme [Herbihabitans rhizosphaerae]